MNELRACVDCKYVFKSTERIYYCHHPISKSIDIITGRDKSLSCIAMRYEHTDCGVNGLLWEPHDNAEESV
jgi:hypothetical protein